VRVPIPAVVVFEVVAIREPWIEIDFMGKSWTDTDLPAEVYLRHAHDVDLGSIEALADFVGRYGSPGWWPWRELPRSFSVDHTVGADRLKRVTDLAAEIKQRRRSYRGDDALDIDLDDDTDLNVANEVHVEEVRLYLSLVRNLTLLWRWVKGDISADEVAGAWTKNLLVPPLERRETAAKVLVDFVNAALARQTVRLELVDPQDNGRKPHPRYGSPILTSTYEAMILQLNNHIAEGAKYLVCANETCERLFVRQDSDEAYLRKRLSDVKYCTISCANAQKQREYRRRQATKRNGVT
jgi:hypothetical protein